MSFEFIRDQSFSNARNCLIITNGSGSGHIQATASIHADLNLQYKELNIFPVDVLKTSYGNTIGNWAIQSWNSKQTKEDVAGLNNYLHYQWVDEYILSVIVFIAFVFKLVLSKIDVVVNTQPIGNKAIIRAVRFTNWLNRIFKKDKTIIKIAMILTELPTDKTLNFFPPIKKLSRSDRAVFKLIVATKPILEKDQTEEAFWQKHCNLSLAKGQVQYDLPPLRPAFRFLKPDQEINQLSLRYESEEELTLMQESCNQLKPVNGKKSVTLNLKKNDKVMTLMLGGQACFEATQLYVEKMIELAKPHSNEANENEGLTRYLFVFCGKHTPGQDTLFKKICEIVKREKSKGNLPENFKVVPVTHQTDEEIAPMMAVSTLTLTKAGGLTALEVNALVKGKIFIHASDKDAPNNPSEEDLMETGMPIWEAGNAEYLKIRKGASIVTPISFGMNVKVI